MPRHPSSGKPLATLCLLAGTILGGAVAASPALAQAPTEQPGGFPPLVAPPSSAHIPGKFVFAELVTPDLAGAERFYGGVFGWSFRDVPVQSLHFAEATVDGRNVGAIIERPLPPDGANRPAWLAFLSTASADATVTAATAAGGSVLFPTRDIPGLGREAVLADPMGAVFAVLQSSSGDPADMQVPDNDWIWSSLVTPDPQRAASFYGALFGYADTPAPDTQGIHHIILSSAGFARASINPLPPRMPADSKGRWLRYIRVDDVAATAQKAVALGGRVVVQPHVDRDGGMLAVIADPQNAVFGILQWPSDAPAEFAK